MSRRAAIVSDASGYMGPDLARLLAERGHDLVVGDPADGLCDELRAHGGTVVPVAGVRDLSCPEASDELVRACVDAFGRVDAAAAVTGRIVVGRFLTSSLDDMRTALTGCVETPYNFLRAVVPTMVDQGDGQVLVFTGAPPTPGPRCTHRPGRAPTCSSATWPTRWPATTCR